MLDSDAPNGSSPVNVAISIEVSPPSVKSSAVSVWIWLPLAGRDSVAIRPSGLPVVKKNGAAAAVPGKKKAKASNDPRQTVRGVRAGGVGITVLLRSLLHLQKPPDVARRSSPHATFQTAIGEHLCATARRRFESNCKLRRRFFTKRLQWALAESGDPPCVLSCLGTVTKFSNSASTEALFVPRRKWHRLRDPSHAEPRFDRLSRRLRETLACLLEGEGDSEKHVASRLGLSQATIHQYVTALYRHFNVGSRAQLLVTIMRRTGRDRREQLPPSRELNRRPGPQAPL